jgi:SAM-dependent methyltransferase
MKGYREIKHTLVEELGFRDLACYRRWIAEVQPKSRPTSEDIARLSPDTVDCRAFWTVCDELFGVDPVCNVALSPEVGRLPYAIETPMDVNRMNLRLASSLGITAFLEENAHARLRVLEIGTGYGSLKNFVETRTNHVYAGFDVVPRVAGVMETTNGGLLPDEYVERERGSFSYVVSTNVFQHLSARQRAQYVRDAHALLHGGGLFLFNLTVDTGKIPAYARDGDGNAWAVHYGQHTPIPRGASAYELVSGTFNILYVTQRYDGLFNFVCQRP